MLMLCLQVREKLETEYKVDIAEHKDEIKKIVNEYVPL